MTGASAWPLTLTKSGTMADTWTRIPARGRLRKGPSVLRVRTRVKKRRSLKMSSDLVFRVRTTSTKTCTWQTDDLQHACVSYLRLLARVFLWVREARHTTAHAFIAPASCSSSSYNLRDYSQLQGASLISIRLCSTSLTAQSMF